MLATPEQTSSSLLESALQYAAEGVFVFPLKPNSKHPLTEHGFNDATTDPAIITEWWRKTPNANIGIALASSGLVAVDSDTYKDPKGVAAFLSTHDIPLTWAQASPRGGEHSIFTAPRDWQFPAQIHRFIDIKHNGYIVAAPSVFEGREYRRTSANSAAPAPDWLLNARNTGQQGQALVWDVDPVTNKVVDGREAYLTRLVLDAYFEVGDDAAEIGRLAWQRFVETVDFSRPTRMTERQAHAKARATVRAQPKRTGKSRLIEGVEPEPMPDELSAVEATTRLDTVIETFFGDFDLQPLPDMSFEELKALGPATQHVAPQVLVNATAGLGKSRRVLDRIRKYVADARARAKEDDDNEFRPVLYFVPRIELADELAKYYGKGAVVLRGRTQGHDKGRTALCKRPDEVKELIAAGIHGIGNKLCFAQVEVGKRTVMVECPFRKGCPYFEQFNPYADVIFLAHELMFVVWSKNLVPKASLWVIDELPLKAMLSMGRGFDPKLIEADELGAVVVAALRSGRDPRTDLIAAGYTKSSLKKYASSIEAKEPTITPNMSLKEIRAAVKEYKPTPLPRVLRRLADELLLDRDGPYCVRYASNVVVKAEDGSQSEAERIWLSYRRRPTQLRKDLAVLMLDATGDAALMRPMVPRLEEVSIAAKRNAIVYQTYGFTASMSKLNGDDDRYRREIEGIAAEAAKHHSSGLVVTYMEAKALIELPEGFKAEHFGNVRGIDAHKDYNVAIIVGRLHKDASYLQLMTKALFYDDPRALLLTGAFERKPVGFRIRDGSKAGVMMDRHPDDRVERMRWQLTEAEIIQAIDRLRLVHRETPALIMLINECATIPIDELGNYRRVAKRIGTAGAGGGPGARLLEVYKRLGNVLPVAPCWLAEKFPHLWKSENAVKMELRDVEKRGDGLASLLKAHLFDWRAHATVGHRFPAVWASDVFAANTFLETQFQNPRKISGAC